MEGSGVSALSPKSGSGCCSLVSIRICWSGMSLYEAAPFFSGTEGCVTQKVRREVSLQITFMVKNVQWPVQWSLFGVIER